MSTIVSKTSYTSDAALNGRKRAAQVELNGHGHHASNGHAVDRLQMWGLSVLELHDAFWKSRGVQCIRLGQPAQIENADLYLLLRPHQLAIFDLEALLNHLIWQGACVTTVHIVDDAARYQESAVTDAEGNIQRIERRYGTSGRPRGCAHLTDQPLLAARWAQATSARQWRRSLRKELADPLVARVKCPGRFFVDGNVTQQAQLLTELVERWPDPERVIDGLNVLENGARIQRGDPPPGTTVVGPAWIGTRNGSGDEVPCIIGPMWLADQAPVTPRIVRVRSLNEIEGPGDQTAPQPERSVDRRVLYPFMKRTFDIAVSAVVLLALVPVLLLVAVAIVIDDGFPVLFRHRRQSRHGKPFDCLKFRTMYNNAERMVGDLRAKNLCDGPQVHIENDPRVTVTGRVLRKLHLDELPQFWNVLTGDMSLVGPRPSPDAENRICPAWRELRLSVRPGITGLWQIKRTREPGRDFQEWIRYDVEYVHRADFWFDLRICVRTAVMILSGRRAQ